MVEILTSKRARRVALIIESKRAYGRRILDGISKYLQQTEPWEIFIEPRSLHDPVPGWLFSWQGDGIIARIMDDQALTKIKQRGIPLVNIKGTLTDSVNLPDFSIDRFAIGKMAAEHLIERQFQNFAFAGFKARWSDLIFQGFSETVKKYGFSCNEYRDTLKFTDSYREVAMEQEIDQTAEWLKTLPPPVGIVAADDYLGIQVLSACRKIGLKAPDMAAVLGLGDDETLCNLCSPTLSSLRFNEQLLGLKSAQKLDLLMRGEAIDSEPELIPPLGITVRHSTDVEAVSDDVVRNALSFIRENINQNINIENLVESLDVPRSTLQRRFKKVLGRSVYETILDWRLRRVMELLTQTDITVKQIARLTGFRFVEHLNGLFKHKTGMTLITYRKIMSK